MLALLGTAACVRPEPPPQRLAGRTPDVVEWDERGRAALLALLPVFRTFDQHLAYRQSGAPGSTQRIAHELDWDPPTSEAWSTAVKSIGALKDRVAALHATIVNATPDPVSWRERRELARVTLLLSESATAAAAYGEDAEDRVAGDPSNLSRRLGRAWNRWETAAEHWGRGHADPLAC